MGFIAPPPDRSFQSAQLSRRGDPPQLSPLCARCRNLGARPPVPPPQARAARRLYPDRLTPPHWRFVAQPRQTRFPAWKQRSPIAPTPFRSAEAYILRYLSMTYPRFLKVFSNICGARKAVNTHPQTEDRGNRSSIFQDSGSGARIKSVQGWNGPIYLARAGDMLRIHPVSNGPAKER